MKINWFTVAATLMFLITFIPDVLVIKWLSVGVVTLCMGHIARKVWLEFNEE